MKAILRLIFVCLIFLSGCVSFNVHNVVPTPIQQARQEIAEDQLLDVDIAVFTSKEATKKEIEKGGTLPGIQIAENHFVPYHLKNTIQKSSQWGMVRVVPTDTEISDVMIKGHILRSNGEEMIVEVNVSDSSGKHWYSKKYKLKPDDYAFKDNLIGEKDVFQDLYNTIANDIAAFKNELSAEQIKTLQTLSKLKFAQDMAPEAFADYTQEEKGGLLTIARLPAEDDPMMERVLKIRERDHMFVDTLNEYYEKFYIEMWSPYEDWRELSRTERIAQAKIQKDALLRQTAGALLVAAAIFMDAKDVKNTGLLKGLMVVSGGKLFIDGVNISKQRKIHAAAIEELSESFDDEIRPIVLELEGKQYELTGSAEEQYEKWRELLRKIYIEETGFEPLNPNNVRIRRSYQHLISLIPCDTLKNADIT